VTQSPFARSVLTSIFTTSLDFGVLYGLVELAGVNDVVATLLGTIVGATSNFLINRRWVFAAVSGHAGHQAARYLLTQVGSSAIHTAGVWVLTRFGGIRYLVAKVVIACVAYLVWNYPMNRSFVFRTGGNCRAVRAGRQDLPIEAAE
jgi:putative flippase GtrA